MRPVPSSKHILSVVIFLFVAGWSGWWAFTEHRLSESQLAFAAAAARRHDPTLLRYDSAFGKLHGQGRLYELPTPVFLALLDAVLIPSGYQDLTLPFRVLAGPMVFLYLCGMYALLWRQTHSSTISAFVAVLSVTVLETFGDWFWGIGPLETISPQGLVIACSPLVLMSYLRNSHRLHVGLTFAFLGLLGNIHLVSASNLALVLLLTHLFRNRFSRGALLQAGLSIALFTLGTLPYLMYFLSLRSQLAAAAETTGISAHAVLDALRLADLDVMYPELRNSLLRWVLYVAALAIPSAVVLWRFEQYPSRNLDLWVGLILGGVLVALGLHGLSQWIGRLWGSATPYVDFIQASAWVMLGLYGLAAQALTKLFRLARRSGWLVRWALAAILVAWILPSDNLRLFRHVLYDWGTAFLADENKPLRVQEIHDQRHKDTELLAVADWAGLNTDPRSLFITDQIDIRARARRSLYVCREDFRLFYYLTPWVLDEWSRKVMTQYAWLNPPFNASELAVALDALAGSDDYADATEWYLIVPRRPGDELAGLFQEVVHEDWGKYWRVLRYQPRTTRSTGP
jgi:hypothetical protein